MPKIKSDLYQTLFEKAQAHPTYAQYATDLNARLEGEFFGILEDEKAADQDKLKEISPKLPQLMAEREARFKDAGIAYLELSKANEEKMAHEMRISALAFYCEDFSKSITTIQEISNEVSKAYQQIASDPSPKLKLAALQLKNLISGDKLTKLLALINSEKFKDKPIYLHSLTAEEFSLLYAVTESLQKATNLMLGIYGDDTQIGKTFRVYTQIMNGYSFLNEIPKWSKKAKAEYFAKEFPQLNFKSISKNIKAAEEELTSQRGRSAQVYQEYNKRELFSQFMNVTVESLEKAEKAVGELPAELLDEHQKKLEIQIGDLKKLSVPRSSEKEQELDRCQKELIALVTIRATNKMHGLLLIDFNQSAGEHLELAQRTIDALDHPTNLSDGKALCVTFGHNIRLKILLMKKAIRFCTAAYQIITQHFLKPDMSLEDRIIAAQQINFTMKEILDQGNKFIKAVIHAVELEDPISFEKYIDDHFNPFLHKIGIEIARATNSGIDRRLPENASVFAKYRRNVAAQRGSDESQIAAKRIEEELLAREKLVNWENKAGAIKDADTKADKDSDLEKYNKAWQKLDQLKPDFVQHLKLDVVSRVNVDPVSSEKLRQKKVALEYHSDLLLRFVNRFFREELSNPELNENFLKGAAAKEVIANLNALIFSHEALTVEAELAKISELLAIINIKLSSATIVRIQQENARLRKVFATLDPKLKDSFLPLSNNDQFCLDESFDDNWVEAVKHYYSDGEHVEDFRIVDLKIRAIKLFAAAGKKQFTSFMIGSGVVTKQDVDLCQQVVADLSKPEISAAQTKTAKAFGSAVIETYLRKVKLLRSYELIHELSNLGGKYEFIISKDLSEDNIDEQLALFNSLIWSDKTTITHIGKILKNFVQPMDEKNDADLLTKILTEMEKLREIVNQIKNPLLKEYLQQLENPFALQDLLTQNWIDRANNLTTSPFSSGEDVEQLIDELNLKISPEQIDAILQTNLNVYLESLGIPANVLSTSAIEFIGPRISEELESSKLDDCTPAEKQLLWNFLLGTYLSQAQHASEDTLASYLPQMLAELPVKALVGVWQRRREALKDQPEAERVKLLGSKIISPRIIAHIKNNAGQLANYVPPVPVKADAKRSPSVAAKPQSKAVSQWPFSDVDAPVKLTGFPHVYLGNGPRTQGDEKSTDVLNGFFRRLLETPVNKQTTNVGMIITTDFQEESVIDGELYVEEKISCLDYLHISNIFTLDLPDYEVTSERLSASKETAGLNAYKLAIKPKKLDKDDDDPKPIYITVYCIASPIKGVLNLNAEQIRLLQQEIATCRTNDQGVYLQGANSGIGTLALALANSDGMLTRSDHRGLAVDRLKNIRADVQLSPAGINDAHVLAVKVASLKVLAEIKKNGIIDKPTLLIDRCIDKPEKYAEQLALNFLEEAAHTTAKQYLGEEIKKTDEQFKQLKAQIFMASVRDNLDSLKQKYLKVAKQKLFEQLHEEYMDGFCPLTLQTIKQNLQALNDLKAANPELAADFVDLIADLEREAAKIEQIMSSIELLYYDFFEKQLASGEQLPFNRINHRERIAEVGEQKSTDLDLELGPVIEQLSEPAFNKIEQLLFLAIREFSCVRLGSKDGTNPYNIDLSRNIWWALTAAAGVEYFYYDKPIKLEQAKYAQAFKDFYALHANSLNINSETKRIFAVCQLLSGITAIRKVKAELADLLAEKNPNFGEAKNKINSLQAYFSDLYALVKARFPKETTILNQLLQEQNQLPNILAALEQAEEAADQQQDDITIIDDRIGDIVNAFGILNASGITNVLTELADQEQKRVKPRKEKFDSAAYCTRLRKLLQDLQANAKELFGSDTAFIPDYEKLDRQAGVIGTKNPTLTVEESKELPSLLRQLSEQLINQRVKPLRQPFSQRILNRKPKKEEKADAAQQKEQMKKISTRRVNRYLKNHPELLSPTSAELLAKRAQLYVDVIDEINKHAALLKNINMERGRDEEAVLRLVAEQAALNVLQQKLHSTVSKESIIKAKVHDLKALEASIASACVPLLSKGEAISAKLQKISTEIDEISLLQDDDYTTLITIQEKITAIELIYDSVYDQQAKRIFGLLKKLADRVNKLGEIDNTSDDYTQYQQLVDSINESAPSLRPLNWQELTTVIINLNRLETKIQRLKVENQNKLAGQKRPSAIDITVEDKAEIKDDGQSLAQLFAADQVKFTEDIQPAVGQYIDDVRAVIAELEKSIPEILPLPRIDLDEKAHDYFLLQQKCIELAARPYSFSINGVASAITIKDMIAQLEKVRDTIGDRKLALAPDKKKLITEEKSAIVRQLSKNANVLLTQTKELQKFLDDLENLRKETKVNYLRNNVINPILYDLLLKDDIGLSDDPKTLKQQVAFFNQACISGLDGRSLQEPFTPSRIKLTLDSWENITRFNQIAGEILILNIDSPTAMVKELEHRGFSVSADAVVNLYRNREDLLKEWVKVQSTESYNQVLRRAENFIKRVKPQNIDDIAAYQTSLLSCQAALLAQHAKLTKLAAFHKTHAIGSEYPTLLSQYESIQKQFAELTANNNGLIAKLIETEEPVLQEYYQIQTNFISLVTTLNVQFSKLAKASDLQRDEIAEQLYGLIQVIESNLEFLNANRTKINTLLSLIDNKLITFPVEHLLNKLNLKPDKIINDYEEILSRSKRVPELQALIKKRKDEEEKLKEIAQLKERQFVQFEAAFNVEYSDELPVIAAPPEAKDEPSLKAKIEYRIANFENIQKLSQFHSKMLADISWLDSLLDFFAEDPVKRETLEGQKSALGAKVLQVEELQQRLGVKDQPDEVFLTEVFQELNGELDHFSIDRLLNSVSVVDGDIFQYSLFIQQHKQVSKQDLMRFVSQAKKYYEYRNSVAEQHAQLQQKGFFEIITLLSAYIAKLPTKEQQEKYSSLLDRFSEKVTKQNSSSNDQSLTKDSNTVKSICEYYDTLIQRCKSDYDLYEQNFLQPLQRLAGEVTKDRDPNDYYKFLFEWQDYVIPYHQLIDHYQQAVMLPIGEVDQAVADRIVQVQSIIDKIKAVNLDMTAFYAIIEKFHASKEAYLIEQKQQLDEISSEQFPDDSLELYDRLITDLQSLDSLENEISQESASLSQLAYIESSDLVKKYQRFIGEINALKQRYQTKILQLQTTFDVELRSRQKEKDAFELSQRLEMHKKQEEEKQEELALKQTTAEMEATLRLVEPEVTDVRKVLDGFNQAFFEDQSKFLLPALLPQDIYKFGVAARNLMYLCNDKFVKARAFLSTLQKLHPVIVSFDDRLNISNIKFEKNKIFLNDFIQQNQGRFSIIQQAVAFEEQIKGYDELLRIYQNLLHQGDQILINYDRVLFRRVASKVKEFNLDVDDFRSFSSMFSSFVMTSRYNIDEINHVLAIARNHLSETDYLKLQAYCQKTFFDFFAEKTKINSEYEILNEVSHKVFLNALLHYNVDITANKANILEISRLLKIADRSLVDFEALLDEIFPDDEKQDIKAILRTDYDRRKAVTDLPNAPLQAVLLAGNIIFEPGEVKDIEADLTAVPTEFLPGEETNRIGENRIGYRNFKRINPEIEIQQTVYDQARVQAQLVALGLQSIDDLPQCIASFESKLAQENLEGKAEGKEGELEKLALVFKVLDSSKERLALRKAKAFLRNPPPSADEEMRRFLLELPSNATKYYELRERVRANAVYYARLEIASMGSNKGLLNPDKQRIKKILFEQRTILKRMDNYIKSWYMHLDEQYAEALKAAQKFLPKLQNFNEIPNAAPRELIAQLPLMLNSLTALLGFLPEINQANETYLKQLIIKDAVTKKLLQKREEILAMIAALEELRKDFLAHFPQILAEHVPAQDQEQQFEDKQAPVQDREPLARAPVQYEEDRSDSVAIRLPNEQESIDLAERSEADKENQEGKDDSTMLEQTMAQRMDAEEIALRESAPKEVLLEMVMTAKPAISPQVTTFTYSSPSGDLVSADIKQCFVSATFNNDKGKEGTKQTIQCVAADYVSAIHQRVEELNKAKAAATTNEEKAKIASKIAMSKVATIDCREGKQAKKTALWLRTLDPEITIYLRYKSWGKEVVELYKPSKRERDEIKSKLKKIPQGEYSFSPHSSVATMVENQMQSKVDDESVSSSRLKERTMPQPEMNAETIRQII